MKQRLAKRSPLAALLGAALLALAPPARADFELTDANGRQILLKDDGTWSYVDAKAGAAKLKAEQRAELVLQRRVEAPGGCRFELNLANKLPYEITSLVPDFSVYRGELVYSTQLLGFGPLKPGDRQSRSLQFEGIACGEISRLQVLGADRCEMGELNKFSDVKGRCLGLIRVQPSDELKFNK
ncbi:hypothetical protein QWJ38_07980 [Pelomonas sp. PFR6]|uniref:DUF3157 family protein n=2 Tax=Roseateles violae TaxID=3058042 RepID=A0ABT8DPF3_9BURK|nr:hypothetical protein [Pelomonas sp. PFR6]